MKNKIENKKVILAIEDDDPIRKAIKDHLERKNFKVFQADTGERGLALVKAENPDLVILDLMLPGMQGEEVLKTMNESGIIKKIPVIVLSAKGDDANINNCIKVLGARDYLAKANYTLKELVEKINKYIK